jgi:hypothetical protein
MFFVVNRKPFWEAGILPLNYSRFCHISSETFSVRLAPPRGRLIRLCCLSNYYRVDAEGHYSTVRNAWSVQLCPMSLPRENVLSVPFRNNRLTSPRSEVQQQGVLTMTPRDRDRLVVLRKAQKKLIGQEQAARECTEEHTRPSMAQASQLPRRTGAVGYVRPRLVGGGARGCI